MIDDDVEDIFLTQKYLRRGNRPFSFDYLTAGRHVDLYLEHEIPYNDRSEFPTPQLILLDWNMPEFSGEDTLKLIRSTQVGALIPVIIISGQHDHQTVVEAHRARASAFIEKPKSMSASIQVFQAVMSFWSSIAASPTRANIHSPSEDEPAQAKRSTHL
nr:response regulator [Acanthopleuribacter pedis]